MPYTSAAEVRMALARDITDPTNPPSEPTFTAADLSNDSLLDAVSEAGSTIDAYLAGRYVVPVADVNAATPEPIAYWTRSIAAYFATLTYRKGQDITDDDPVVRRYAAVMLSLTAVRDGKAFLQLPTTAGSGAGSNGAGDPINQYVGRLFDAADWQSAPRPDMQFSYRSW